MPLSRGWIISTSQDSRPQRRGGQLRQRPGMEGRRCAGRRSQTGWGPVPALALTSPAASGTLPGRQVTACPWLQKRRDGHREEEMRASGETSWHTVGTKQISLLKGAWSSSFPPRRREHLSVFVVPTYSLTPASPEPLITANYLCTNTSHCTIFSLLPLENITWFPFRPIRPLRYLYVNRCYFPTTIIQVCVCLCVKFC